MSKCKESTQEYSFTEIADTLGISKDLVYRAYQSGMKKIAIECQKRGITLDDIVGHTETP